MAHMNNFKIALKQKRETEKNKKQNRILINKILDRLANLWTNILHQELGLFTIPFLCFFLVLTLAKVKSKPGR